MKFGVTVPNNWGVEDPQQMLEVGRRAEELGYDSVWVMDHLFNTGRIRDRLEGRPYYHPLATLSYLSAVTNRVALGTSVLVLPYHNPVELAKYVASLDQMSAGRVILGVGAGAMSEGVPSPGHSHGPSGLPDRREHYPHEGAVDQLHAQLSQPPVGFLRTVLLVQTSATTPHTPVDRGLQPWGPGADGPDGRRLAPPQGFPPRSSAWAARRYESRPRRRAGTRTLRPSRCAWTWRSPPSLPAPERLTEAGYRATRRRSSPGCPPTSRPGWNMWCWP